METRAWEIYSLSDPRTEQIRYIGVTFRGKRRLNEHLSRAMKGGRTHRDNWIRSLVAAGVRPDYRVIVRGQGDGWQDAERRCIAQHRPSCDLVNLTDGGDGNPGYVPTPELRERWSKLRAGVPYAPGRIGAMKGKRHTPEAVEKIRAASTGRAMPETMRTAVSARRKNDPQLPQVMAHLNEQSAKLRRGRPLSDEHRAKIAATTTNRKPIVCVETGVTFPSVTALARSLNVTEASVSQAIRKGSRCKGCHYRPL